MDSSFLDAFSSDLLYPIAIIAVSIVMMRMIPRMVAGVQFVEPSMVNELMQNGEEVVVIDVRTTDEFTGKLGHMPGAVNLQGNEIGKRLKSAGGDLEALKNEKVFVICRTHNRSPRVARVLKKAGFVNVAVVKGGMVSWNNKGLPIESQS